jgi:hypothetical protein
MNVRWFGVALCTALAACGSQAPLSPAATQSVELAAQSLNDMASQNCPFPPDVSAFEVTTLTARGLYTPKPNLGVFDDVAKGCAVLVFTLDDNATVSATRLVSESPAGFGAVAVKILRWNNYAEGASQLTKFMVRVAGEKLPAGGAMTSLAFKDTVINLEVPP